MKDNKLCAALIGGSGFDPRNILADKDMISVRTPFGDVDVAIGMVGKVKVAAINRHRDGFSVPAHLINHRANISALWWVGVDTIISTSAVGGINRFLRPGYFVLVDQYIHLGALPMTFFDGNYGIRYCDMTKPYCKEIRKNLQMAYESHAAVTSPADFKCRIAGTYICTNGPQFETPAEIKFYEKIGGDVIGMTNPPEAKLSRELGICYQTICVVANYATGIKKQPLSQEEVYETMAKSSEKLSDIIARSVANLIPKNLRSCQCGNLKGPTDNLTEVMKNLNKRNAL